IQGSYSTDFSGDTERIMQIISEPIDQKIYFAGEALSFENQSTVHGASQTAYAAVERMLKE
ncbi:MAG: FAD-dependent oxidoreductase, partial [Bacteroidota bacterium]